MTSARRFGARIAVGVAVGCIVLGTAWRAAHWNDYFQIEDTFDPQSRTHATMELGEGEYIEGRGVGVGGGETAVRKYFVFRTPEQRLYLRLVKSSDPGIEVRALVRFAVGEREANPGLFDGRRIDITGITNPARSNIELHLKNNAPEGAPAAVALERFVIEREGPGPEFHFKGFVFFFVAGAFFWIVLVSGVIPSLWGRLGADRRSLDPRLRVRWSTGALIAVGGFVWVTMDTTWTDKKDYDDRAAIGNSAHLIRSGHDVSEIFFRSRARPGFPAAIEPLIVLFPHELQSYWVNPSDNFQQYWYIYDQDNWSYGRFVYPLLSLFAQALALLMIVMLYAIYRALGLSMPVSGAAALLSAVFYRNALAIPITQTFTLFINVAAVWAFLAWGGDERGARRFLAGTVLGFALLVKETAGTTALAIGLFTLANGSRDQALGRLKNLAPYVLGAAIWPLIYFGAVIDGGFGELFTNFDNHLSQQQKNEFRPLTPMTATSDLWAVFSVALPLIAAGVALAVRRFGSSRAFRFLLCWSVACLPVFALPYIFPRFLQYFIPSFALWTVIAAQAAFAAGKRMVGSAQAP